MLRLFSICLYFSLSSCQVANNYCGENSQSVSNIRSLNQEDIEFIYKNIKSLAQEQPNNTNKKSNLDTQDKLSKYGVTHIKSHSKNDAIAYLEICSFDVKVYLSFSFYNDSNEDYITLNWGGDLDWSSEVIYGEKN